MIAALARLVAKIGAAAFVAALCGCQGIIGANGGITGLTVPPGCKAQGSFSYPMPQGAIMFSCDETGVHAAAAALAAPLRAPLVPAGGAHLTVDRAP